MTFLETIVSLLVRSKSNGIAPKEQTVIKLLVSKLGVKFESYMHL